MQLSDYERHELEQIERSLCAEDPVLAKKVGSYGVHVVPRKRVCIGIIIAALGVVVVGTGAVASSVLMVVIGFLGMFAGTAYAVCLMPVMDNRHRPGSKA